MIERLEDRLCLAAHDVKVLVYAARRLDPGINLYDPQSRPGVAGIDLWLDKNGNGKRDRSDPTARTNKDGFAVFKKVADGEYDVHVQPLKYPYLGVNGSDVERVTLPKPNYGSYGMSVVTIGTQQEIPSDVNAWFQLWVDAPGENSVSGNVFFDKDGNGKTSDRLGDPDVGYAGVRVYLDVNNNAKRDEGEISTITNANGYFGLSGMRVDEIASPVRVLLPANTTHTTPAAVRGKEGGALSFGIHKPMPTATLVTAALLDASLLPSPSNDAFPAWAAHRFMQGVRIYIDLDRDGKFDKKEPTVFSGSEQQTFTGLLPGKYRVRASVPDGLIVDRPYVDVVLGDRESKTRMFSFKGTQTLGLRFFDDLNDNGRRDAGEPTQLERSAADARLDAVRGASKLAPFIVPLDKLPKDANDVVYIHNLPPTAARIPYYLSRYTTTSVEYDSREIHLKAGWRDGTILDLPAWNLGIPPLP